MNPEKALSFDIPGLDTLDVSGRRVLCRVDFNVPFGGEGGERRITDDTRVRAALPTLREILARGGQPVLMCHLGRPKGQVVDSLRVDPIAACLEGHLGQPVVKLNDSCGPEIERVVAETRDVCLLENVRFHPGETKGDPELAAAYARLGDVFVNDAFGASHRDHSSVTGPARHLPSAAGLLLQKEIDAFRRVLEDPARPLVAILGGAKVSDKLPVVARLIEVCDAILIGGGMAYTFLEAMGRPVGTSLLQDDQLEAVRANLTAAAAKGCELGLPTDHVVAESFAEDATPEVVTEIPVGAMGLDIGPESRQRFAALIAAAKTLIWNGPMGVFEWSSFRAGTESVGRAVAASSAYTVVGGGDSVAALELLGLSSQVDHVSTGGGASLELLEGKLLPGFAALQGR